ncbi:MAG TPA: lysophospholipid acyltransferase family protein [Gemmataceae bacterium]|nr:lysophospholipid acyltransferase family protein [Gemmataceae bacterium]
MPSTPPLGALMTAAERSDYPSHLDSLTPAVWFVVFLGMPIAWIQASAPPGLWNVWAASGLGAEVVALFYWHRYRGTGFVPYALTCSVVATVWAAAAGGWCAGTLATATAGFAVAVIRIVLFVTSSLGGSWVAVGIMNLIVVVAAAPWLNPAFGGLTELAMWSVACAAFAWYWFFRPWFELTCEPVLWWMYKIRAAGPGLKELPPTGPCLVIANHASWLDPLFLAKVLPRRTTPMMTAKFYDKRVIGWLVRRFGVIRVPEHALKQDTPELREAIAALDRGECVVIFPEGFLRRSEDKPLKRFGRGVWQILRERPDTTVFTVWIEGAWGSYCSYWNGPPTKNKKRDRRRPIGIGVSAAVTVPADVLAHHLRTRVYLMNQVLAARTHLGLPPLSAVELPTREEDGD